MQKMWIFSMAPAVVWAVQPQPIEAPIRSVRIHPEEAWVTRVGKVHVPKAGSQTFRLGQLPGDLMPDGLRVSAKGPDGTRMGEIRVGPDRSPVPETPEMKQVLARLEELHQRRLLLNAQQAAAEKSAEVLGAALTPPQGTNVAGSTALPSASALVELNRAVEARWVELAVRNQARSLELEKLGRDTKALETELQQFKGQAGRNPNPRQVTVELMMPRGGDVELEVSYRTTQARWKPSYEARLATNGSVVELALYAEVSQVSGEPWEQVRLELSNSHPSRVLEMVSFSRAPRIGWAAPDTGLRGGSATVEVVAVAASVDKSDVKSATAFTSDTLKSGGGYVPPAMQALPVLDAPATSLENVRGMASIWSLEGLREVPSDGDAHRFLVDSETVSARTLVAVAPRLNPTAFQVARFQAPSHVPMFPGALILRSIGNMRVGSGHLALPAPNQPFELNFGPYTGLRVSLHRLEEKRPFRMTKIVETRQYQKGIVKNSVKEEVIAHGDERVWELHERMILSNDTDAELNVEVQDRLVQSIHESITVRQTPDTTPGAVARGPWFQVWSLRIPGRSTQELTSGILIRAPKEGELTGLRDLGLE